MNTKEHRHTTDSSQSESEDPNNWSGFADEIYFSRSDKRWILPRRRKWIGWAVNLAQPAGVIYLYASIFFLSFIALLIGFGFGSLWSLASTGSSTVTSLTQEPVGPYCAIEKQSNFDQDEESRLQVWKLRASGLKRLTARLLVSVDGATETWKEVEYLWESWDSTPSAATGILVLQIQDSQAFGQAGKRHLNVDLDLGHSPPHSSSENTTKRRLDRELESRATRLSQPVGSVGRQEILYAELFSPPDDASKGYSLSGTLDSLSQDSKNGRVVVALELTWEPQ